MAIKNIKARHAKHRNVTFKDSALAHEVCLGQGIEIGPAAHNPFNLPNCRSVGIVSADTDDYEFFKQAQLEMCGSYAEIELEGEAHDLPLPDHSQDYVVTSHVIEHVPDPISAFLEWSRVLKLGGVVFMIFPKRSAHPPDRSRPINETSDFVRAYYEKWTPETVPAELTRMAGGNRGHYWVFDLKSMAELIAHANDHYGLNWEILEMQETDDKVGNGHTLVAQHVEPVTPKLDVVWNEFSEAPDFEALPTESGTQLDDDEDIPMMSTLAKDPATHQSKPHKKKE